ncbi:MAG: hypothetical protein HXX14_13595 [Bacteroidetes bacterium]|nr:hypothetical protein [Bacteroidota bacterium]
MALTKVLVTVKTYPTISAKYDELVCTAGFREDGSWIRIYPFPFRKKSYDEQYKKYDWIELDLVKNAKDFRPESYRPVSHDSELKIVEHLDTKNNWAERKQYVLGKVYSNLSALIGEAKSPTICTSLAVFKPSKILDLEVKAVAREWDKDKLAKLQQLKLFDTTTEEGKFKVVKKLPYKFSYKLLDDEGKESSMMIEDWEIGQLFWNCLVKHSGDEASAINDVRAKYFTDFTKNRDLHLFLGTTQTYHYGSHNPFIIIGTFHPKIDTQFSLF